MDEHGCYRLLRRCRWPRGLVCVTCGNSSVTVHSRSQRTPRLKYLCLQCHRTFTDLTGTPFAGSKLPLGTWFRGLSLVEQRLTNVELARAANVKWETAQRMTGVLQAGLGAPGLLRDLHDALKRS